MLPVSLALALVSGPALAQSTTTGASDAGKASSASQSNQTLPQQIQSKLRDQGFTNVQVVPGSFLVSAKDKQGDPVTMIIGPNSMTVFTMSSSDSSTVGSSDQDKKSGSK
ncbi:hypothetical protein LMTR13_12700 [Bradyrhizobium icense]|uniref:PepSY domain-containing protein n=2 Tax=Bradyrhizobium icense TaxID=1274631 RepID=A0A1B1UDS4_9BRAD|nr:hypothetical protein LMTR13_12700 [Bradyrhizobium icense]